MTPEQLETILRKVINEGVTLDIWYAITISLLCLISAGLGAYIRKKGDNLATKEDIGEITRKVQEVETEFLRLSNEHQIRFSKLHEKRGEVISELYSRLYDYYWAVCGLLRNFHCPGLNEQDFKKLDDKSYKFSDYFHKHRIFFNEDICSKIDEIIPTLYSAYVPLERRDINDNHLEEDWQKCADIVQKQYPKIKESLESDLRKILGVSE